MKRKLFIAVCSVLGVVALAAALIGWFVYSTPPEVPHLSGILTHGSIAVGGRVRTYRLYVPKGLAKDAPLVMALHGSGETGAQMRAMTGYGFERLADAHGFAVVYPDGYQGYWNGCNITGDYAANRLNIDDVAFLTALTGKLVGEIGIDRSRVFATGISRGGSMAMRLAIEAPSLFRAVAIVSESVPTPDNFKCKPVGNGTSSLMIMNGDDDPIVPFDGGEVNLLGIFLKRGNVLSWRASGEYFARLDHLAGTPERRETQVADGVHVEQLLWQGNTGVELDILAIHGGGHGMPQPYLRYPRLLGPTAREPNGPALIWDFFARQRPRQP